MEALLLIDIQNDYFPGGKFPLKGMKKAARRASLLLKKFRDENKPVIHIQHINLRPDSPFFHRETSGAEIHNSVIPLPEEKRIIKHYPNSFRKTGLERYLEEKGITTLHIAGAMSNMCVDSTVRAAFDKGYTSIVHSRACAAKGFLGTSLVHAVSMKTLGSIFAEVR